MQLELCKLNKNVVVKKIMAAISVQSQRKHV